MIVSNNLIQEHKGIRMEGKPDSGTTTAFRLKRKAVKEIFSNRSEGIDRNELESLALAKGIAGNEFDNLLKSLLAGGHLYFDEAKGKFFFVRNE